MSCRAGEEYFAQNSPAFRPRHAEHQLAHRGRADGVVLEREVQTLSEELEQQVLHILEPARTAGAQQHLKMLPERFDLEDVLLPETGELRAHQSVHELQGRNQGAPEQSRLTPHTARKARCEQLRPLVFLALARAPRLSERGLELSQNELLEIRARPAARQHVHSRVVHVQELRLVAEVLVD